MLDSRGAGVPAVAHWGRDLGALASADLAALAEASAQVSPDFTWGPTMTQTYADVSDGFKAAASGDGSLLDALTKGQESTISTLEAQSIPVAE